MTALSIQNISTFEHLELDANTESWVRSINHCFTEDTIVENDFMPGLYITILGKCQYCIENNTPEEMDNHNYHYVVALTDELCSSRILFPKHAVWQTFSIMLPLDQLHEFGVVAWDDMSPEAHNKGKITELGSVSGDILRCCESVWNCTFSGLERQLFIKGKAFEVLSLFLNKRREEREGNITSRMSQLNHALTHIENNLDQNWNLSSVARLVGSNQTYIKQDIKDLIGTGFRDWLKKKRLNSALELLSGDDSIHQVACDIGFKSQAHFATLFKNETGFTPREYRQSLTESKIS